MTTLHSKKSIDRLPLWCVLLLGALALVCFALSQSVQAVSPPPDGGYPGGNTAEGDFALLNLTGGTDNTAVGAGALFNNTTGNDNTATGYETLVDNTGDNTTTNGSYTLHSNTTGHSDTALGWGDAQ